MTTKEYNCDEVKYPEQTMSHDVCDADEEDDCESFNKYTNKELKELWSNHKKRKAFVERYWSWGAWIIQPKLNLTYYKYDLPDGKEIIVVEHIREAYPGEQATGEHKGIGIVMCRNLYLKRDIGFDPASPDSMTFILEHLKYLKKEIKDDDSE